MAQPNSEVRPGPLVSSRQRPTPPLLHHIPVALVQPNLHRQVAQCGCQPHFHVGITVRHGLALQVDGGNASAWQCQGLGLVQHEGPFFQCVGASDIKAEFVAVAIVGRVAGQLGAKLQENAELVLCLRGQGNGRGPGGEVQFAGASFQAGGAVGVGTVGKAARREAIGAEQALAGLYPGAEQEQADLHARAVAAVVALPVELAGGNVVELPAVGGDVVAESDGCRGQVLRCDEGRWCEAALVVA